MKTLISFKNKFKAFHEQAWGGGKRKDRVSPRQHIGNGDSYKILAPTADRRNVARHAFDGIAACCRAIGTIAARVGRFGPRRKYEMILGRCQWGRDPPRGIFGSDRNGH